MPFSFIQKNLRSRKLKLEDDIHEQSLSFLKNVDKMYKWIVENINNDIKYLNFNEVKDVSDTHKTIMSLLNN